MSSRYKFYGTPNGEVFCVSSYAGRKIRRKATCSKNDMYDFEKGCKLAQARVDVEVARRRMRNANTKYDEAYDKYLDAENYMSAMSDYLSDAENAYDDAITALEDLLEEM